MTNPVIAATRAATLFLTVLTVCPGAFATDILVEAEAFTNYGGWLLDAQFVDQMGSPYLLSHGLGRPVDNASTTFAVPVAGDYRVWVRVKDWVPSHHPGRFQIEINGTRVKTVFGTSGNDWHWQDAGRVRLESGLADMELCDLTGFDGRCDAIFLSTQDVPPPDTVSASSRNWRKRLLGIPREPQVVGDFDVIVVGGGVAGCASALSAARLGCHVALIQNRPVLGGNGSREVGIRPRGELGDNAGIVRELVRREPNGDLAADAILKAEPNVSLFLEHHADGVVMKGRTIVAVDARHTPTGRERRFRSQIVIDCTGRAAIGMLAGAETRFGREARGEFREFLAPESADDMHHGNTVTFRTAMRDGPVSFPAVPWATAVAKDYADLGGQVKTPGVENWKGPMAGSGKSISWTHFWEYGQWLDPYLDAEKIRDHLLCAIYGTFANVKQMEPDRYANLALDWVGYVPATGEFRRLLGDYTLTERDILTAREFPDSVAINRCPFCLHYPGTGDAYDFRLSDWKYIQTPPYHVPFRCLYSRNVDNLMMAGKHISVSHVAGSSTKVMLNGGQHGVAVGSAAYLCRKYGASPRQIRELHIAELQDIVNRRGQYANLDKQSKSTIAPARTDPTFQSVDRTQLIVALMADPQLHMNPRSLDFAQSAMNDWATVPHDFLVVLGDLVQNKPEYFADYTRLILKPSTTPVYSIAGNAELAAGLDAYQECTQLPLYFTIWTMVSCTSASVRPPIIGAAASSSSARTALLPRCVTMQTAAGSTSTNTHCPSTRH